MNPYAPPEAEPSCAPGQNPSRYTEVCFLVAACFGYALLMQLLIAPLILGGGYRSALFDGSSNLMFLQVAVGVVFAALVAWSSPWRWWRITVYCGLVLIALAYLWIVEWPVAIWVLYLDLSNLYFVLLFIAATSALPMVAILPRRHRWKLTLAPYLMLGLFIVSIALQTE